LLGLAAVVVRGLWSYYRLARRGEPSPRQKAEWLHHVCAGGLAAMEIQVFATGHFPANGLIVANHLSYLDILVLSATLPCALISKAEIERWPIIGRFARWAGTVFVKRHRKGDAAQKNSAVTESLATGVPIVLFPEGRTTDGHQVLRFHSTMLQPALDIRAMITPCALAYELDEGSIEHEVCYWGDMTLWPHGMNLLGKRAVRARISFGDPIPAVGDRKPLSRTLHHQVVQLYSELRSNHGILARTEEITATSRR
jgi:1-acyl-sn-glycerol-3-phosphate acyltransferase